MINGIGPDASSGLSDILRTANELQPGEESGSPSFKELLSGILNEVDQAQEAADQSIQGLAAGDSGTSIQDVVLKMEEADLAFRLMKEVRDKLIQAYKETVSMQT